jgi:hypothetical protein
MEILPWILCFTSGNIASVLVAIKFLPQSILKDGPWVSSGSQGQLQLNPTLLVVDQSGTDHAAVSRGLGGRDHADVDTDVADDGNAARDGVGDRRVDADSTVGTCRGLH